MEELFADAERNWKQQQKSLIKPQGADKIWMQLPDGWAWWWLPRAYCSAEAEAMGHCGNRPRSGEKNVSILSLREPKQYGKETRWYPHLTFILHGTGDSGMLGEMKGRDNDKPVPKYHPYIVALLKDERIKGVMGGGYLPAHNFKLSDLSPEMMEDLSKARPELASDDARINEIIGLLELDKNAWDAEAESFVVKSWATGVDLLSDLGLNEVVSFYKSDREPDQPRTRDLMDILTNNSLKERWVWGKGDEGNRREPGPNYLVNFGYALLYENMYKRPDIIPADYDPEDKDSVEAFLDKLTKDGKNYKVSSPAIKELVGLHSLTVPQKYDAESEL